MSSYGLSGKRSSKAFYMKEFLRKILMYGSLSTLKLLNLIQIFPFFKRIRGKTFYFTPDVFSPHFFVVSSQFFLQNLHIPKGSRVLDLGTGSGILAVFAAEKAANVIATDLNPKAIQNARINVKLNRISRKVELRRGNLFKPVSEKFDVILFNPPYYPLKPKTYMEAAWCCGPNYLLLRKFLKNAKKYLTSKGFIQITFSSYMNMKFFHKVFKMQKFRSIMIARKFLFFEILYIYLLVPEDQKGVEVK